MKKNEEEKKEEETSFITTSGKSTRKNPQKGKGKEFKNTSETSNASDKNIKNSSASCSRNYDDLNGARPSFALDIETADNNPLLPEDSEEGKSQWQRFQDNFNTLPKVIKGVVICAGVIVGTLLVSTVIVAISANNDKSSSPAVQPTAPVTTMPQANFSALCNQPEDPSKRLPLDIEHFGNKTFVTTAALKLKPEVIREVSNMQEGLQQCLINKGIKSAKATLVYNENGELTFNICSDEGVEENVEEAMLQVYDALTIPFPANITQLTFNEARALWKEYREQNPGPMVAFQYEPNSVCGDSISNPHTTLSSLIISTANFLSNSTMHS